MEACKSDVYGRPLFANPVTNWSFMATYVKVCIIYCISTGNNFYMHVCDVFYNFVYIMILFISRIWEVGICDIKIIGDIHH